jgi:hypothetical protein
MVPYCWNTENNAAVGLATPAIETVPIDNIILSGVCSTDSRLVYNGSTGKLS